MIFAEICRKKIEAMNERDRTRTMNGSLYRRQTASVKPRTGAPLNVAMVVYHDLHSQTRRVVRVELQHCV